MKMLLAAFTSVAILAMPFTAIADHQSKDHHSGAEGHQHDKKAFMKKLKHANFLPTMMKTIMKNREALKLTPEQISALKKYHKQHGPETHAMINDVVKLEKKARELALSNYPPQDVAKVGEQSIHLRHQIMVAKLKCRSFVKSVLTPEQFKDASTKYSK